MATEQNKELLRRFYQKVWNEHDTSVIDEYIAEGHRDHTALPSMPSGREGFRQLFTMLTTAFPDFYFDVEEMIAEGDKVAARVTAGGTQEGEWMGVPPTGKQVELKGIEILRIQDGKITDHWGQYDMMGLMQQLGAVPEPGQ